MFRSYEAENQKEFRKKDDRSLLEEMPTVYLLKKAGR